MTKKLVMLILSLVIFLNVNITSFAEGYSDGEALPGVNIYSNSIGSAEKDKDADSQENIIGKDYSQDKFSQYEIVILDSLATQIEEFKIAANAYATQQSSFSIIMPKTIILIDSNFNEFIIKCKGNLSSIQAINIAPDRVVKLYKNNSDKNVSNKQKNTLARIKMNDTLWTYKNDFKYAGTYSYIIHDGYISTDNKMTGSWVGIINFEITIFVT